MLKDDGVGDDDGDDDDDDDNDGNREKFVRKESRIEDVLGKVEDK